MSENALQLVEDIEENADSNDTSNGGWELKKLKPKHMQICALLAQGFKHVEIAAMVKVTPQYITMLLNQPLIFKECQRLAGIAGTRLEAMTVQSAEVIADAMKNGNHKEKLSAARLQLEVTKRIGRPDPLRGSADGDPDRLDNLARKLESLLDRTKPGLYDEKGHPIFEEAEIIRTRPYDRQDSTPPQVSGSIQTQAN